MFSMAIRYARMLHLTVLILSGGFSDRHSRAVDIVETVCHIALGHTDSMRSFIQSASCSMFNRFGGICTDCLQAGHMVRSREHWCCTALSHQGKVLTEPHYHPAHTPTRMSCR